MHESHACMQSRQSLSLGGEAEATASFPVAAGAGLEVVLAQFWKSEGCAEVSADAAFHGVSPCALSSSATSAENVSIAMVRRRASFHVGFHSGDRCPAHVPRQSTLRPYESASCSPCELCCSTDPSGPCTFSCCDVLE